MFSKLVKADIAACASRQITFRDGHLVRDEPVAHPRDAQAGWAVIANRNLDEDL